MRRIPPGFFVIPVLLIQIVLVSFTGNSFSADEKIRVHFIDVGYGDAILLEIPGKSSILIDTGSEEYSDKLTTYLKNIGIDGIYALILTHPHKDHFGGISSVIENFSVKRFFYNGDSTRAEEGYSELIKWINSKGLYGTILRRGDDIKTPLKNLKIKVLNPEALLGAASENSIALYISYGNTAIFLTSDIGPKQQDEIISEFPELRSVNVVQVPHHGGKISDKFAEFFKGRIFIISIGENKWGRPFKEDLDRLKGKVLRTDKKGTIIIESNGKKIKVLR